MNNYDLFQKPEIKHILNNDKFDSGRLDEIAKYLELRNFDISKLNLLAPKWGSAILESRLKLVEENDDDFKIVKAPIQISKSVKSVLIYILGLVVVISGSILGSNFFIDEILFKIILIAVVLIILYLGRLLFMELIGIKNSNSFKTVYHFNKNGLLEVIGKSKIGGSVKNVNFFWSGVEIPYHAKLELQLEDNQIIKIDESHNHFELFEAGSILCNYLNKKLVVFTL